ncbi:MAG: aminotransferase class V-fold PLP-dependent enzyme [Phycisphaerae bacterium]
MWDVETVREDFPILQTKVYGRDLVYLDNSATTQKPQQVLQALQDHYTRANGSVHRSAHYLSQQANTAYEQARQKVCDFIGAESPREIVFTSGTTESINLVAHGFCRPRLAAGRQVLISAAEHHSNLVPWQMLCEQTSASVEVIPIDDDGSLDLEQGLGMINDATCMLAITAVSNVLGTINPLEKLIEQAHRHGAVVLVDGAQAAPHRRPDVGALDCDFYAFSGHKVYAPAGCGVLYGKRHLLEQTQPLCFGGGMIGSVDFDGTTLADPPYRFEAGTRDTAGAVGLAAAIDYLDQLGWDSIHRHEQDLLEYATQRLEEVEAVTLYGKARPKHGVISFTIDDVQGLDAASIFDKLGVAVRSGHHCAQPLMQRLGISGTLRASLACYNTRDEIDRLIDAIDRACRMLR